MTGFFRPAALLAGLLLVASACTSSTSSANISPESSPSTETSPSPTPTPSPVESPSPSPSPAGTALAITGLPFHNGEVGIGYLAVTLTAAGGTPPYSWSVSGGQFPPGLTLSPDGVVSGTSTQAGKFSFTVKVSDSLAASVTSPAGFGVYSALTATQPCAVQCIVGEGCSICGGFGSVTGGLPPYTYSITSDHRPPGMGVSGLQLTGAFPPPGPLGAWSMTVQVVDQFGAQRTVNAIWAEYPAAVLNGGNNCQTQKVSGSCTATGWTYSFGNPNATPRVVIVGVRPYCPDGCFYPDPQGLPPPGWSTVAKGGTLSISAGPVTCSGQGEYAAILTLALQDLGNCPSTDSNQVDLIVTLIAFC